MSRSWSGKTVLRRPITLDSKPKARDPRWVNKTTGTPGRSRDARLTRTAERPADRLNIMMTRIATLATLMTLVGCVTAESHDDETIVTPVTVADFVGRWQNAAGEIHDLRADGTWVHSPATVLRGPVTTGTWHLTDFGGEQYLVTVAGGTGAQRIVNVTADALELAPGGVYDLDVAVPSANDCTMPEGTHLIAHHCYDRPGFDECLMESDAGAPMAPVIGCHPFGHAETCVETCDALASTN